MIYIIGYGAMAKAIASGLKGRKNFAVVGRNNEKLKTFAKEFGCEYFQLDGFDISNKIGRTFILHSPNKIEIKEGEPFVALFSGGTSDAPVIEEAADVCLAMEVPFIMKTDVGVAGLHRLLTHIEIIKKATAIIVVAGMEGALPSVIGGLAEAPVFAVPTSVGYGVSFDGVSALLGMLNSCASGVTVSNIDNGFSAAFTACQVIKQVKKFQSIPLSTVQK